MQCSSRICKVSRHVHCLQCLHIASQRVMLRNIRCIEERKLQVRRDVGNRKNDRVDKVTHISIKAPPKVIYFSDNN